MQSDIGTEIERHRNESTHYRNLAIQAGPMDHTHRGRKFIQKCNDAAMRHERAVAALLGDVPLVTL